MNFPLLKTFNVSSSLTSFLEKKLTEYVNQEGWHIAPEGANEFNQNNGYQTFNLLEWDDKNFKNFTQNELLDLISFNLEIDKSKISYNWIHFLSYENGGMMKHHKHWHAEDFVMFIYLKTCSSGRTIFYLNDYNEEFSERTHLGILPQKNLGAIFSSLILHQGEFCTENKKIFVVGIRVDLRYKK